MSDKYTQKIAAEMLKKFNSQGALSKTVDSAFGKFDESTVFIPWYLKPFAKKIRAIACHHFFSGYFSGYYIPLFLDRTIRVLSCRIWYCCNFL